MRSGTTATFSGTPPRNFDYTPAPLGGNPDAGDTPTGHRRGAGRVPARRRDPALLPHQLVPRPALPPRLRRGGRQLPDDQFQRPGRSAAIACGPTRRTASGTNNANFSTPPDGMPGRMQMYRFTGPTLDRDGGLDAEIVIHELTHGLSNRLVGNAAGLFWNVAGGLGEGWSDFYALSLLNGAQRRRPGRQLRLRRLCDLPARRPHRQLPLRHPPLSLLHGQHRQPAHLGRRGRRDRELPRAASRPARWASSNGGAFEVHNVGEIWALTLWEVRSRVIADPAGANGGVPTGNQTMLQLVTDALKLTPIDPSFIDARDALLDADCATNACANERWIWDGFADRGLGYGAVAPLGRRRLQRSRGHMGIGSSFGAAPARRLGHHRRRRHRQQQRRHRSAASPSA